MTKDLFSLENQLFVAPSPDCGPMPLLSVSIFLINFRPLGSTVFLVLTQIAVLCKNTILCRKLNNVILFPKLTLRTWNAEKVFDKYDTSCVVLL